MGRRIEWACLALMLAVSTARGDSAPSFEDLYGPPIGDAGGLMFELDLDGPLAVTLGGCVDGQPNCALARSRNLLGMEVVAVDGVELRPEGGFVRQIMRAFADEAAGPTITLELRSRTANGEPIHVDFARR